MPMAQFVSGHPEKCDYTPGSAVTAGDVIVTSGTTRIAHLDIEANALGALSLGGGIYDVAGDAAIAADKKVWWNAAASQITETASTHKVFGVTVTACSGAAATCEAFHNPGQ